MSKQKTNKIFSLSLSLILIFQQCGFAQVAAQIDLAGHFAKMHQSMIVDRFRPLHLRFFSYDPSNDHFELFLDKSGVKDISESKLQEESQELLKYFLIGITLPDEAFWVNLRPDSPDSIIDPQLATTNIGKVLLEADLELKKDTAGATSPNTKEGREYWDKLYKKAGELLGGENITIPTLTRPWIVPGEVIIRQTETSAYVYKATLKVMLEEDYLKGTVPNSSLLKKGTVPIYSFQDPQLKQLNEYSTQLIKELIIPKLTQEVNSSKRYAALRQVFYSLILARWFKQNFQGKPGLYPNLINKQDLTNLTSTTPWSKETYFQGYQKSFKDGEYNFKEPAYTPFGQVIRSYFSGGMNFGQAKIVTGGFQGSSPVVDSALASGPGLARVTGRATPGDPLPETRIGSSPVPDKKLDRVLSGLNTLMSQIESFDSKNRAREILNGESSEDVVAGATHILTHDINRLVPFYDDILTKLLVERSKYAVPQLMPLLDSHTLGDYYIRFILRALTEIAKLDSSLGERIMHELSEKISGDTGPKKKKAIEEAIVEIEKATPPQDPGGKSDKGPGAASPIGSPAGPEDRVLSSFRLALFILSPAYLKIITLEEADRVVYSILKFLRDNPSLEPTPKDLTNLFDILGRMEDDVLRRGILVAISLSCRNNPNLSPTIEDVDTLFIALSKALRARSVAPRVPSQDLATALGKDRDTVVVAARTIYGILRKDNSLKTTSANLNVLSAALGNIHDQGVKRELVRAKVQALSNNASPRAASPVRAAVDQYDLIEVDGPNKDIYQERNTRVWLIGPYRSISSEVFEAFVAAVQERIRRGDTRVERLEVVEVISTGLSQNPLALRVFLKDAANISQPEQAGIINSLIGEFKNFTPPKKTLFLPPDFAIEEGSLLLMDDEDLVGLNLDQLKALREEVEKAIKRLIIIMRSFQESEKKSFIGLMDERDKERTILKIGVLRHLREKIRSQISQLQPLKDPGASSPVRDGERFSKGRLEEAFWQRMQYAFGRYGLTTKAQRAIREIEDSVYIREDIERGIKVLKEVEEWRRDVSKEARLARRRLARRLRESAWEAGKEVYLVTNQGKIVSGIIESLGFEDDVKMGFRRVKIADPETVALIRSSEQVYFKAAYLELEDAQKAVPAIKEDLPSKPVLPRSLVKMTAIDTYRRGLKKDEERIVIGFRGVIPITSPSAASPVSDEGRFIKNRPDEAFWERMENIFGRYGRTGEALMAIREIEDSVYEREDIERGIAFLRVAEVRRDVSKKARLAIARLEKRLADLQEDKDKANPVEPGRRLQDLFTVLSQAQDDTDRGIRATVTIALILEDSPGLRPTPENLQTLFTALGQARDDMARPVLAFVILQSLRNDHTLKPTPENLQTLFIALGQTEDDEVRLRLIRAIFEALTINLSLKPTPENLQTLFTVLGRIRHDRTLGTVVGVTSEILINNPTLKPTPKNLQILFTALGQVRDSMAVGSIAFAIAPILNNNPTFQSTPENLQSLFTALGRARHDMTLASIGVSIFEILINNPTLKPTPENLQSLFTALGRAGDDGSRGGLASAVSQTISNYPSFRITPENLQILFTALGQTRYDKALGLVAAAIAQTLESNLSLRPTPENFQVLSTALVQTHNEEAGRELSRAMNQAISNNPGLKPSGAASPVSRDEIKRSIGKLTNRNISPSDIIEEIDFLSHVVEGLDRNDPLRKEIREALTARLGHKEESVPVRAKAAEGLVVIGDRESTAVLVASLRDGSLDVRESAFKALVEIGDIANLPVLKEAVEVEKDMYVKSAMEAGIKKIGGRISSPVQDPGGIDLTRINLICEPMGNFAGLALQLPKITDLENFSFSEKLTQIKNLLLGDNIPNGDRFSELLSVCFAKKAQGTYLKDIVVAMLESCRAEEELALESSPEIREAILLAEVM